MGVEYYQTVAVCFPMSPEDFFEVSTEKVFTGCPENHDNPDRARYCLECGEPLFEEEENISSRYPEVLEIDSKLQDQIDEYGAPGDAYHVEKVFDRQDLPFGKFIRYNYSLSDTSYYLGEVINDRKLPSSCEMGLSNLASFCEMGLSDLEPIFEEVRDVASLVDREDQVQLRIFGEIT